MSWGQEGFQNRLARDHAPRTSRFPLQILCICLGPNPTFCFQTMLYSHKLLRRTLPPGWTCSLTGMIPNTSPEPQSQGRAHQCLVSLPTSTRPAADALPSSRLSPGKPSRVREGECHRDSRKHNHSLSLTCPARLCLAGYSSDNKMPMFNLTT